jgi:hypothetical protein
MVAEGLPAQLACRVLDVSESGFYAWRSRPPSERPIRHAWLTDVIGQIHVDFRGVYGYRRVHAELTLGHGLTVGAEAVWLLMRKAGLQGLSGRPKYRRIPNQPTASDLVDQDFARSDPDRLWVTDITEHPTREGKVYCAVVLDVFSRRPTSLMRGIRGRDEHDDQIDEARPEGPRPVRFSTPPPEPAGTTMQPRDPRPQGGSPTPMSLTCAPERCRCDDADRRPTAALGCC